MKYSDKNQPIKCIMTQSVCYKETSKMSILGVLWHSTGANNPTVKRYVQPSDNDPNREELLKILGVNSRGNDWNHSKKRAGVNAFVGKMADGSVESIQVLPWDYSPWGCGKGSKGSCNNGWLQFEICEDNLKDKDYFNAIYQEGCELTAYWCALFGINPKGTVKYKGIEVPTILCHKEAGALKLGSNHSDVMHWFKKHGKTMNDVRNDVAKLLEGENMNYITKKPIDIIYQTWDDVKNKWLSNVTNNSDYAGIFGNEVCAVYANLTEGDCVYKVHTLNGKWLPEVVNRTDYAGIFNKPIDGFMIKSNDPNVIIHYQVHLKGGKWLGDLTGYNEKDADYGFGGVFGKAIDAIRMYIEDKRPAEEVKPEPEQEPSEQLPETNTETTPEAEEPKTDTAPEVKNEQNEQSAPETEEVPEEKVETEEKPEPEPEPEVEVESESEVSDNTVEKEKTIWEALKDLILRIIHLIWKDHQESQKNDSEKK